MDSPRTHSAHSDTDKMCFDVTSSSAEGPVEDDQVLQVVSGATESADSQECTNNQRVLTEPDHLSQESTNNLQQNVTRYVIPEACLNIAYAIACAKRDAFRDASSICKTRVTSVTVMGDPKPRMQLPSKKTKAYFFFCMSAQCPVNHLHLRIWVEVGGPPPFSTHP